MQTSRENNQTVTIVPLSSYKESRQYNKRSTIEIGDVAEIPGSKQSVALVNQIRAIDKMRLIGEKALGNFVDKVCEKLNEIDGEFEIQFQIQLFMLEVTSSPLINYNIPKKIT